MAQIAYAPDFVDDLARIELESKREDMFEGIELLATMPEIGSKILADSIVERFGSDVRKLIVERFIVIYRYYPEQELVYVIGAFRQRAVQ